MTLSGQPPAVGSEFGRYRIESQLGLGGMGVVYAATDLRLRRLVALKVVSGQLAGDQQFVDRFNHEADVLTRLDSPHIIAIFDHGDVGGVPYLATQYVAGGDLGAMLHARGPLSPATASAVCAQVAEALQDAHRAGVVHRDVKSSNVLVRDPEATEPFVYLCDFGIAQTEASGLTKPGGLAGSWAYVSPERARGESATPASDVYSLGCLLWVCLTGRPPYAGTDVEMALAHLNAPVPAFEGDDPVAGRVNAVLARAMAKRPADRYQTAAALRADLVDLTALARAGSGVVLTPRPQPALPVATDPGATVVRAARRPRRRVPLLVTGLVVVAVTTALGVRALRDDGAGGERPNAEPASGPSVAGDYDDDGLGDVALRWYDDRNTGQVRNYLLRSDGSALAAPTRIPSRDGLAVVGDVDGKGPEEVVLFDGLLGNDKTAARTLYADGTSDYVRWPASGNRASGYPLLADVDGDGDDDLVLVADTGADTGANLEVATSGPDGFSEPVQWYLTASWNQFYDGLYAGDVDGDGHSDLVANVRINAPKGEIRTQLRVLFARGSRFEPDDSRRTLRVQGDDNPLAVVGDVDGDGSAEVVAYLPGPDGDQIRVYDVSATTGLSRGVVWGSDDDTADPDGGRTQLALSDVDGDGDDDLVLVRPSRDGGYVVDVEVSTGSSFAAPAPWAEVPCFVKACKEAIFPLGPSL